MRSWSISEARSRIADLFEAALSEGPQKIERREQDAVVVISASAWRTIENEYADFADLILSAAALRQWLLAAETVHAHRIVPVSAEIAHAAGALLHRAFRNGGKPSSEDALIAATADRLGFRLLSRNAKHMRLFGVDFTDPLSNLPD